MPDAVEELSDGLRALGVESSLDLGDWSANRDEIRLIGPVLTVRYAPKTVRDDDMRMGNAQLVPFIPPGAVLVEDARGCEGCVLGGRAAAMLAGAGAVAAIVDGSVRDPRECDQAGLAVIAARFGVQTGRQTLQMVEVGGRVTLRSRLVCSGDTAVLNRLGLAVIPQWVAWSDVRPLIGLA
jgi:regulator of RNase E activity RraA